MLTQKILINKEPTLTLYLKLELIITPVVDLDTYPPLITQSLRKLSLTFTLLSLMNVQIL